MTLPHGAVGTRTEANRRNVAWLRLRMRYLGTLGPHTPPVEALQATSLLRHLRHVHIEPGLRQQRCQREGLESIAIHFRVPVHSGLALDRLPAALHIFQERLRPIHTHITVFGA